MRSAVKKSNGASGGQIAPQVIGAVAVAVVGAVAALFAPVGDWIRDRMWRESIVIDQTMTVVEGRDTPLQVVLRNGSEVTGGLSGGVVTLSPTDSSIRIAGPTTLTYAKSDGSVTVGGEGGPTFRAMTVGEQRIKVDVATNRDGKFSGFITVKSLPAEASVTESDLSGAWRIRLNDRNGAMTLKQRSRNDLHLTGQIQLDGAPQPLTIVDGFRDGVVFAVTAEGAPSTRYDVEGVWCAIERGQSRWMIVNARVQGWNGGRRVPAAAGPRRLEERCPDADAMLAEGSGDGVFHASAPLG